MQLSMCEVNNCDFVVWTLAVRAVIGIGTGTGSGFATCDEATSDGARDGSLSYCQQPEDDRRMIGCGNEKCTNEWFHFQCLVLP